RARIANVRFYGASGGGQAKGPRRVKLRMRFYAHGSVRRFECRIDHNRFRPCRSPERMAAGGRGIHSVSVRAVGATGLHGPAARTRFYIGRICHHSKADRQGSCMIGAGEMQKGPGWAFG
ncbi:MAG TPA: hypothetical protein VN671_09555, partial [Solirubrobacterales bacterium]|nr:hypothetical protein [Solirubrobacterales bacterium]